MTQEEHNPDKGSIQKPYYRFKLFVAGEELNSNRARAILSEICRQYFPNCCQLDIVDVYTDFKTAIDYGVIIIPTLIIEEPLPIRTIVGSLSAKEKVLAALGITITENER